MLGKMLRGLVRYIDKISPQQEIAGLDMPLFYEGDLIESVGSPDIWIGRVDPQKHKALIIDVVWRDSQWCYNILLDGTVWNNVSSRIVEGSWRLSKTTTVNQSTEQSN